MSEVDEIAERLLPNYYHWLGEKLNTREAAQKFAFAQMPGESSTVVNEVAQSLFFLDRYTYINT